VEPIEEEKEEVGRFTAVMLHSYHHTAIDLRWLRKDKIPPLAL